MIRRLRVEDFFLLKDIEVEFGEGLNVISGETGAGKSMTLSAIAFVLGKVGDYPEGCSVELELEREGEVFILRREIKGGRSRYFLNGRGTTLKTIREITQGSISIHGQNEFIKLMKPEFQRDLLDRFGNLYTLREEFGELFSRLSRLKEELRAIEEHRREIEEKRDYLEFKLKEVEEIGLSLEEFSALKERARILNDLEKFRKTLSELLILLYEGEPSVYSFLSEAERLTRRLSDFKEDLEEVAQELADIKERIFGIYGLLSREDVEVSEEEINEINEKIFKVQMLEKRWGKDYGEILKEAQRMREDLRRLSMKDQEAEHLREEIAFLEEKLSQVGGKLSELRKQTAQRLVKEVEEVLKDLGLERAKIEVEISQGEADRYGFDRISILFSSYGEDLKPIGSVASGGELIRIFLAFALIMPPSDTYIFDEVDAGISGETSVKVARLLKKISRNMQIIAVTHSAPLCASGDVNLLAEKRYIGDIPYITVRRLSSEEKLKEVARLMGAQTESTLRGARELVNLVGGA